MCEQKVMASGDVDMISKAEALSSRKTSVEDTVNKLSMQKNVLIGQQMEAVCVQSLSAFISPGSSLTCVVVH